MNDRPAARASSQIPTGTRLNGIYEIEEHIASGGMGEIYRGHAIQTGDPVAIKVIRPELAHDEAVLALFRKEASALHYLHNEAIVRYFVFSVDPDLMRPYLAMEFVDGQSLSDLVQSGPLKYEAVMLLKRRIASALQAAHEHGIIHRDVSPDNIIIPKGNVANAKIIDFGIARSTQIGEGTIIGGGFAGKYNYVSPEQLGLFGGEVTGKSDIYSLGLVLAQASSGQAINMSGNQVEVVDKRRVLPPLGNVDERLRPLLEQMLQPRPEDRPESMAEVAAWLPEGEEEIEQKPKFETTARTRRRKVQADQPKSSRSSRWAIAAVAAVVLVGGVAVAIYELQSETPLVSAPQVALNNAPKLPSAPPSAPLAGTITPSGAASTGTPARPPSSPEVKSETRVTPPAPPAPSSSGAAQPANVPPVASLPPSPSAPPPIAPQSLAPVDKVLRFINEYDGGDCFYAAPVAVAANSAKIEGYGSSVAPFDVFDFEFKRANGFEADIGVRQVTKAQCPAVAFLSSVRGERVPPPVLELAAPTARLGSPLTGKVSGFGSRNVALVLIADDGTAYNLTSALKASGDSKTFSATLPLKDGSAGQPQLLLALATAAPLDGLKSPMTSDQVFTLIQTSRSQKGQIVTATSKYFKVER